MGPNIISDRALNMTESTCTVPDASINGCHDRLAQEHMPWNGHYQNGNHQSGTYHFQDSRNRKSGSPYYQHFERQSAEQEKQKFLLNNGIQWADCQPDVKRKLNEVFFRGSDLRYSPDAAMPGATSVEQDASG